MLFESGHFRTSHVTCTVSMTIMAKEPNHILYYNKFSICSLMVRYCLAVRGQPQDLERQILVKEVEVDIVNQEQLTEDFLCNVNPAGEVDSF